MLRTMVDCWMASVHGTDRILAINSTQFYHTQKMINKRENMNKQSMINRRDVHPTTESLRLTCSNTCRCAESLQSVPEWLCAMWWRESAWCADNARTTPWSAILRSLRTIVAEGGNSASGGWLVATGAAPLPHSFNNNNKKRKKKEIRSKLWNGAGIAWKCVSSCRQ